MVKLHFDTDIGKTLNVANDISKAFDKVGDSMQGAAREANALEKAAKRIVDSNLSPQEKYNQKLEAMAKAVKAGKLSMEDMEKTAGRMRQKLDGTGSAFDKIASSAAGIFSVTTAVAAATAGITKMDEAAKKAADSVFNSLGSFGELQQVATSPEDYAKLIGKARGLVKSGVFSEDQKGSAADLVFAMRNAGYGDADMGFIQQLGESKQVKPENLKTAAEGLKKYQSTFGEAEAGSIRGIGQKVFAAANAMQTDFAEAASASTRFGTEAAALKYSDEESLAGFAAIEQQSPNTEQAATRMRSLLSSIQKNKLSKGTFSNTIANLVGQVQKGKSAIDIIPDSEGAAALNILASAEGQSAFQKLRGEIGAAQNQDLIGARRFITGDPILGAGVVRQQEEGALASVVESRDATRKNLMAAVNAGALRTARESGRGAEAIEYAGQYTLGYLMPDDTMLRGEQRGGYQHVQPDTAQQIEKYLSGTLEEAQKQTAVLERIEKTGTLKAPKPSGRQE